MTEVVWTRFVDKSAASARELQHEWRELIELLQHAGPYPAKSVCPWIKLARFGTARSQKGALRHDGNIVQITGVEGDYDAEKMQPEEAIQLLERAGLRAVVYTSPSHTSAAPRWRVLAPLSTPADPAERSRLLSRINGVLGGVLTAESFTLSQAYYYGRVQGQDDYRVLVTFEDPDDGIPVDQADELDAIAIARAPREHLNGHAAGSNCIAARVEQLGRRLRTGDGRRELLKSYIGDRSNRGLTGDEIRVLLDDVASRFFDQADPIDWSNINRLITDITETDAAERAKVDATVGEFIANLPATRDVAPVAQVPAITPLDLAVMAGMPPKPIVFLVDKWLPVKAVTVLTAHGGVGKSLMALQLAVCMAQGLTWFGKQVTRSRVLMISCEDDADAIHWRLACVCKAMGVPMESLREWLTVFDMSEQDCVLWARGQPTARMKWLAQLAIDHHAECVIVDNASDTFGDNENDRTAVRAFVRTLARVAIAIKGAVLLLAHVDKASARGVIASTDSYSGSTAWHNSSRSRWAMTRNKDDSIAIANEKNNYAAKQDPFTVVYDPVQHVFVQQGDGESGAASELLQNKMRLEIMRAIGKANSKAARICAAPSAPQNNAFRSLPDYGLPSNFSRDEFWQCVDKLVQWGFLEERDYKKANGGLAKELFLTDSGKDRCAQSSGAPPAWRKT